MNIFFLDWCPVKAAQYQCDKHVVKMVLESAQLLSTVYHVVQPPSCPIRNQVYKATHVNHPCSKWARESGANFDWLARHGIALCEEYTFRYGKIHKCENLIRLMYFMQPGFDIILNEEISSPAQAMPLQYKRYNPVEAYRAYYIGEKAKFAKWVKGREAPDWWRKALAC